MIATGKWPPGGRLPSIRQVRGTWGMNQAAVEAAYGRLVALGLAESRPRSGYYVAGARDLAALARHRATLRDLHGRVASAIREETGLSVLGALRYLARLEEIERAAEPEVGFVECTLAQAQGHAEEIAARLRTPVMPLVVSEVVAGRSGVPSHLCSLLTSAFHRQELQPLEGRGLAVTAVPIEVSPEVVAHAVGEEVILLERDEMMASHVGEDAARVLGERVATLVTAEPVRELERLLRTERPADGLLVLLSPRLWGEIPLAWQEHAQVQPLRFRIAEAAWPRIGEAIGVPLPTP
jgi:DNA-binding transcriptional regulator YhcF (GntR family)